MASKRVIAFYSHIPSIAKKQTGHFEYHCFSNWAYSPFTIEGKKYIAAEQRMMEQKALLFNDKEVADKVMDVQLPSNMHFLAANVDQDWQPYNSILKRIKDLGRQVQNFDSALWTEKRFDIVYDANLAKFRQNRDFAAILQSTKKFTLAEASPHDIIWGIGLATNDPDVSNPEMWRGKNILGQVLMKVRDDMAMWER